MIDQTFRESRLYHVVYKTTCLVNAKYYIGVHSTNNLDDGYLGSGSIIKRAIKKYGRDQFRREILEFCSSKKEALSLEKQLVTEQVLQDPQCYNVKPGGGCYDNEGYVTVTDGISCFKVGCKDPRYISGELKVIPKTKGQITVRNSKGECFNVSVNDPRYLSGELIFVMKDISKGRVVVRDQQGNVLCVSKDDPRYISGELVSAVKGQGKGLILVRDKDMNYFRVPKDDPRYVSGELVASTSNLVRVHSGGKIITVSKDDPRYLKGELCAVSNAIGKVTVRDKDGHTFQVQSDDLRYLSGELVGATKGLVAVRDKDGHTFHVQSDDPRYLSGELYSTTKGRRRIHKGNDIKMVYDQELPDYLNDGWVLGYPSGYCKLHRKDAQLHPFICYMTDKQQLLYRI